jgi:hypothetical protein
MLMSGSANNFLITDDLQTNVAILARPFANAVAQHAVKERTKFRNAQRFRE